MAKTVNVRVKAPEKTEQSDNVEIPDIEIQVAPMHIVGLSPIIMNRFTEKSRQEMADKAQPGGAVPKRQKRPPRFPDKEYEAARILDSKGNDCVPARYVKAALVTATRFTDKMLSATMVAGSVYVLGDLLPIVGSKVYMRNDMVRVGQWRNKQPMERYRPCIDEWSLSFKVQYEPRIISLAQLVYLVRRAGLNVGLCEWRPEKKGEFGRFDLKLSAVK